MLYCLHTKCPSQSVEEGQGQGAGCEDGFSLVVPDIVMYLQEGFKYSWDPAHGPRFPWNLEAGHPSQLEASPMAWMETLRTGKGVLGISEQKTYSSLSYKRMSFHSFLHFPKGLMTSKLLLFWK